MESDLDRIPVRDNKKNKKSEYSLLRQKFQLYLGKLTSSETKDVGLKEIQALILSNQGQQELRVYLSTLAEHKRPLNYTSNEQEVLVIGFICSVYKENLLDPLDQPPSLQKSAFRIIELLQKYFKDTHRNVQDACAKSWKELYKNVLLNQSLQVRTLLLYDTLAGQINTGTDRISQETSTVVLDEFLLVLTKIQESDLLAAITKKFLTQIYFKTQIDHPSMPRCVKHIITGIHMKNLVNLTPQLLDKTLFYLTTKKKPDVIYKTKIESCEVLEIMAIQMQEIKDTIIGTFSGSVLPVLQDIARDRVLRVQNAAKRALKEWRQFQDDYDQLEYQKLARQPFNENLDIDQIIEKKTQSNPYGAQYNGQQIQQPKQGIHQINDETDMKRMMGEQGGWVKETRGRNFQRKQSGTGGGQTVGGRSKSRGKSSNGFNSKPSIKEIIMNNRQQFQGENQNKLENVEFVGYEFDRLKQQQQEQNTYYPIQNIEVLPLQNSGYVNSNGNININQNNMMQQQNQLQQQQQQQLQQQQQQLLQQQQQQQQQQQFNQINQHQMVQQDILKNINPNQQQQQLTYLQQQYQQQQQQIELQQQQLQEQQQLLQQKQQIEQFQKPQQNNFMENQQQQQNLQNQFGNMDINEEQNDDFLEDTQDFNSDMKNNNPQSLFQKAQSQKQQQQDLYVENMEQTQLFTTGDMWETTLQYISQEDYESAYTNILDSGDDLYFLRLMMMTGKCLSKLSRSTAARAVNKYLEIYKSQFLEKMCLDFYQDSLDTGYAKRQPMQDQNIVIKNLYEMSGQQNEVGQKSAQLYNQYLALQQPSMYQQQQQQ